MEESGAVVYGLTMRRLDEICRDLLERARNHDPRLTYVEIERRTGEPRQYIHLIKDRDTVAQVGLDKIFRILDQPEIGMTDEERIEIRVAYLALRADGRAEPFRSVIEDLVRELERGNRGPVYDRVRGWILGGKRSRRK